MDKSFGSVELAEGSGEAPSSETKELEADCCEDEDDDDDDDDVDDDDDCDDDVVAGVDD